MPLKFKPFHEMTPEDYDSIGLKCGLEVHQQLLTERKLFCRCPAGRYTCDYDAEVLRHMRPTLSELGEYDGTALMEKKTKKNIYYRIHHDTVCTYEFDDTPPFFPDETALDISLEISLLCNLNMVSEIHIARKQYLDGSIPTGFQRTAILGVDGWIPYPQKRRRFQPERLGETDRKVGIRQLSLEEDACREVSDVGHDRVYLTDRLGMPLVEIVTEPDMRTPQEIAEVCQLIRMLCRSTGKVRTGYGAAREDVNVSVRGGTRVEVKGVPQITRIPLLVYNEARRQWSLLQIRDLLKQRGVTEKTFKSWSRDVTRSMAKTIYQPVRDAVEAGLRAKCVLLRGFAGVLNLTTQEHTTFAKEFSDRVRVIACLTQLPNIVHSDMESDSLTAMDWKGLRKRLRAEERDALVLVWGSEEDTRTACNEIAIRGREATQGIPNDTRQALKDGTNGFERVLPGADRMYPDTDLPPMAIPESRLERVRARLPMPVWDREARYREMGLPDDVIGPLCISRRVAVFDRLVDELKVNPTFAAVILVQRFKALRREGLHPEALSDDEIQEVFEAYSDGRLAREGVIEVLAQVLQERTEIAAPRVASVLKAIRGTHMDDGEIEARIAAAINSVDDSRFATTLKKGRYLMGVLMRDMVGRAEGRRIAEMLYRSCQLSAVGPRQRRGGQQVGPCHPNT
ncbi:MAG: Glu-tRNA(Gln) amidotransferase subunit GatE [Phycisphaerae bacterium]|nr:Glu-tRNA(Gln) amidotransferase subunit GatE [Phycisphaerae bacterium]